MKKCISCGAGCFSKQCRECFTFDKTAEFNDSPSQPRGLEGMDAMRELENCMNEDRTSGGWVE